MNQQQVTINLPAQHPVRAMHGLARSIALPAEHAPQRFPSFPALERTAVMAFTQPTSVTLPASTDVKMMLCRQAAYPAWANTVVSGATAIYSYPTVKAPTFSVDFLQVGDQLQHWGVGNQTGSFSDAAAWPTVAGALDTYPVPYAVIGVDDRAGCRPFAYVPPSWSVTAVVTHNKGAAGAAFGGSVSFEMWSSPGEISNLSADFTGLAPNSSAMTAPLAVGGVWIRPSFLSLGAAGNLTGSFFSITLVVCAGLATYTPDGFQGQVDIAPASQTSLLPVAVSAEFANSTLPWYATRTTAAAMLGTNVTKILDKAGTVLGGRISPNVTSPWTVDRNYISALHPAEKAWLPLETGLYTFCPPSTDLANFWDYTLNTSGGAPAAPVYRLDNDSMVNILFVKAGAAEETLAVTVSWHIEFRTSSTLFQIALSGTTLETFHQAQLSLAAAGFFFDNPDHRAILSKVIGAVNKVAPYAFAALQVANPKLASAAKVAYNAVGAVVNKARSVPVANGPMRIPATSATRNGLVQLGRQVSRAAKGAKKKRQRRGK